MLTLVARASRVARRAVTHKGGAFIYDAGPTVTTWGGCAELRHSCSRTVTIPNKDSIQNVLSAILQSCRSYQSCWNGSAGSDKGLSLGPENYWGSVSVSAEK
ncbi:hypothetical protein BaRGS_00017735 [Batillaria attramentaria]|uniref:Uncharacterized protein n=1 Tax=Batillaria attramentaria TaxID=370345 RepID=A0ABD0KV03_9CAEN